MTPERFWLAAILFHAAVVVVSWRLIAAWRGCTRRGLPTASWVRSIGGDVLRLTVLTCGASFLAAVAANPDHLMRLRIGSIAGRLLGQALFGEAILVALGLALVHARAAQRVRAGVLGAAALGLLAVYVEGYRREPHMLRVRQHAVDRAGGAAGTTLRILHITDIQTPAIGAHEERALRAGLGRRPDLIILTGDYVQDELGRPTEHEAKHDLRALMARIGFDAPLGVFATEGDAGPPCRDVFAGTSVQCLVDDSTLVAPLGSGRLAITGLSARRGRTRNSDWLAWLMRQGPRADHRILISHAPDFVDAMPRPVDLVLAGHTHGGQVVIPFFGPPMTKSRLPRRYAGGLHDYRGIPLHVSRGVGMERGFAPPIRFLCPPEVCIIDLHLPGRGAPVPRG